MPENLRVECPSGLVVTLREFKVVDEDLLADPKAQRKGAAIANLLSAITETVEDPGPYGLSEDKNGNSFLDWNKVLVGDRMVALLRNRIYTWGATLPLRVSCQRNPARCPSFEVEVDLDELPVKELPETSKTHVIAGSPLKVELPRSGLVVHFKLLRGEDERRVQKLQKQKASQLSSSILKYRTVEIEGVSAANIGKTLRELGGYDSAYLRAAFDEADCGVEQEFEFECPECNHSWVADVELRESFLFPKYRGKIGNKT